MVSMVVRHRKCPMAELFDSMLIITDDYYPGSQMAAVEKSVGREIGLQWSTWSCLYLSRNNE